MSPVSFPVTTEEGTIGVRAFNFGKPVDLLKIMVHLQTHHKDVYEPKIRVVDSRQSTLLSMAEKRPSAPQLEVVLTGVDRYTNMIFFVLDADGFIVYAVHDANSSAMLATESHRRFLNLCAAFGPEVREPAAPPPPPTTKTKGSKRMKAANSLAVGNRSSKRLKGITPTNGGDDDQPGTFAASV
jgi:hypothetical protein